MADQLEGLWVGLGYFMPGDSPLSHPRVSLTLEVNIRVDAGSAKAVLEAMQAVLLDKPTEWSGIEVTIIRQWVSINRQRPFQDYLNRENHLQKVTKYLLDCIEAVEKVREMYLHLPWSKPLN